MKIGVFGQEFQLNYEPQNNNRFPLVSGRCLSGGWSTDTSWYHHTAVRSLIKCSQYTSLPSQPHQYVTVLLVYKDGYVHLYIIFKWFLRKKNDVTKKDCKKLVWIREDADDCLHFGICNFLFKAVFCWWIKLASFYYYSLYLFLPSEWWQH